MHDQRTGTLARNWSRVRRLSNRAWQRVQGMPLRASCRKLGQPVPPGRLIHLVAGTEDVTWFLESGAVAAQSVCEILGKHGRAMEAFTRILDFGCGVGRVMRHWSALRGPALHGADYNPDLITWCRENLPFAQFQVNGLDRRLIAEDATFDFIYALSVFTHLSESVQHFWMDELTRVLCPGGYLLITTHGARYLEQLTPQEQAEFHAGQVVVRNTSREGSNHCASFHPESYVRTTLARNLDVLDFIPEGALGNPRQDVYLLKKRSAA